MGVLADNYQPMADTNAIAIDAFATA